MALWNKLRDTGAVLAIAAAPALLAASSASAATYHFVYTAPGISASGLLTTSGVPQTNPWPCPTCNNGVGDLVTAISGMRNGVAITGLVAPGGIFGNDNHIYTSPPYLDWGDLGFSIGGVNYNVFQGNFGGHPGYFEASTLTGCCYSTPISFSLTAVPEPASWALMLVGFAGLGAAIRARPRQAVAA